MAVGTGSKSWWLRTNPYSRKITTASRTASIPIVLFWRRRKASAPCLMASEIARMGAVPVSFLRTQEARKPATKSDPMENVRMSGKARSKAIRRTPVFA